MKCLRERELFYFLVKKSKTAAFVYTRGNGGVSSSLVVLTPPGQTADAEDVDPQCMSAVLNVAGLCVHSVGLPLQTPARPGRDPQNYGPLQRYDTHVLFFIH